MRKATPATSPTSIAAEWEEAMLLSCLSPNENSGSSIPGSTASIPRIGSDSNAMNDNKQHVNSYGYHDDDDVGGLLQLSSESSFTSFDSSDSDISLCRNTSPNHKNKQQQQRPLWGPPVVEKNSLNDDSPLLHPAATATSSSSLDIDNNNEDDHHDDGDCSAITAVSLANLFLGSGGPCDLHLESDEGVEVVQAELLLTANNTRLNALTSSSNHTTLSIEPRPQPQRLLLLADNSNSHATPPPPSSLSASREVEEDHRATTKATAATASAVSEHGAGAVATTPTPSTQKNRNVHFGRVHIRQFGISISENPCVGEGPPIELGWDFREKQPSQALSVDQYEAIRLPRRRRRLQDFLLSDRERRRMLLARYTHQDIKECIRQVEQIKRQRVLTYLMLPASALDEAAEDMYRYVTRSFK